MWNREIIVNSSDPSPKWRVKIRNRNHEIKRYSNDTVFETTSVLNDVFIQMSDACQTSLRKLFAGV